MFKCWVLKLLSIYISRNPCQLRIWIHPPLRNIMPLMLDYTDVLTHLILSLSIPKLQFHIIFLQTNKPIKMSDTTTLQTSAHSLGHKENICSGRRLSRIRLLSTIHWVDTALTHIRPWRNLMSPALMSVARQIMESLSQRSPFLLTLKRPGWS